ncbi:hypothetical protein J2W42_005261 [Rhizobium tibeticum]|uniref:DUF6894 domain-containing protein n=1 Tax=Rhizobium tibeticum TaxID=501024 RepID=A0A1H8UN86_9HYPH|nr:hypothetical protein [Rhizobium tibeticum]MDP9812391.1 hypothetical protein [Rhizobium tibeticum]SEI17667.1 hypothetical protein RTCCBAU85039_5681 [Rhizobium tibeticum]SEP04675.1 hypothetical protein SAMN05216228_103541 [Rhizobium tibeticum]
MTKYFFHLRTGNEIIEDEEGVDLDSAAAAHREAITAAREMLAEAVLQGNVVDGQVFEITDNTGRIIERLPLKEALRLSES